MGEIDDSQIPSRIRLGRLGDPGVSPPPRQGVVLAMSRLGWVPDYLHVLAQKTLKWGFLWLALETL